MKLLRSRLIIIFALLSLLIAACDVELDNDETTQPTPITITSTPTTSASGDDPTPTEQSSDEATATVAGETATEADSSTPTEADDSATATEDSSGEPTAEASNGARAEIEAIEADVVELRGLELLEDLDEQVIDREELAIRVQQIIEEEYSPEEARIDSLTYWLLRLIPDESLDLYQLQIDLLSEQIAGYYDPETKELVVVTEDGNLAVIDKVTMAHEIVHALQDQHFDLIAIDEFAVDADHDAAITALIEGDATLSMTDYMLGYLDPLELIEMLGESLTGTESTVLDTAPRYISDGLLFSYESGQTFATALFDEGGFDAINEAFSDPPTSTEQILHPEKYLAADRDDPLEVDNPDISGDLGSDWELLRGDVLGEWDLQIMLEDNGVAAANASTAVEGWGGTWFDIYESDNGSLALLTTRWDSDADATEYADALLSSFGSEAANGEIWTEAGRSFSVVAGGDTVVMISGTDEEAVQTVLSLIEQTV